MLNRSDRDMLINQRPVVLSSLVARFVIIIDLIASACRTDDVGSGPEGRGCGGEVVVVRLRQVNRLFDFSSWTLHCWSL